MTELGGNLRRGAQPLNHSGQHRLAAAPANRGVAAVRPAAAQRDEQLRAGRRRTQHAGALTLAELDRALSIAFAVTDAQGAQVRAVASRAEVRPPQSRELLAAQAAIAQDKHDREVACAGERVVGDRGLRRAHQIGVLLGR
jgi:hypothetical protein